MTGVELRAVMQRPVFFNPSLVKPCGGILGALMVSQAIGWSEVAIRKAEEAQQNGTADQDPFHALHLNGWFYKTVEQWERETGMTRSEQETARKYLRQTGFWQEDRKGSPARNVYRVDMDALAEAVTQGIQPAKRAWSEERSAQLAQARSLNYSEQESSTLNYSEQDGCITADKNAELQRTYTKETKGTTEGTQESTAPASTAPKTSNASPAQRLHSTPSPSPSRKNTPNPEPPPSQTGASPSRNGNIPTVEKPKPDLQNGGQAQSGGNVPSSNLPGDTYQRAEAIFTEHAPLIRRAIGHTVGGMAQRKVIEGIEEWLLAECEPTVADLEAAEKDAREKTHRARGYVTPEAWVVGLRKSVQARLDAETAAPTTPAVDPFAGLRLWEWSSDQMRNEINFAANAILDNDREELGRIMDTRKALLLRNGVEGEEFKRLMAEFKSAITVKRDEKRAFRKQMEARKLAEAQAQVATSAPC